MTDDDCEPDPAWLAHLLEAVNTYGADCATGPMHSRMPPGAPAWLTRQPFSRDVHFPFRDGQEIDVAATNNSIIRTRFLVEHPDIRFDPRFGVLGGEDMVFYRSAARAGLEIRYASSAAIWANEPPSRATFSHQVWYRVWLGNSEAITNLALDLAPRSRLVVRALRRAFAALTRPACRIVTGKPPEIRYAVASMAGAFGMLSGTFGIRLRHPQDG